MRRFPLACLLAFALPLGAQEAPAEARGYLGVRVGDVDDETRAMFELPRDLTAGCVLLHVEEESAAAKAGLRAGDVVTSFAGQPVKGFEDLVALVTACKAGDETAYVVRRGTGTIEGKLRLGRRPPEAVVPVPPPVDDLDRRLDRLQEHIAELRRRALEARERRPARGLAAWIEREERGLVAARERRDEEKIRFHEIRLGLLREMGEAGAPAPGRRFEDRLEEVVARLEEKLEARLERLEARLERLAQALDEER